MLFMCFFLIWLFSLPIDCFRPTGVIQPFHRVEERQPSQPVLLRRGQQGSPHFEKLRTGWIFLTFLSIVLYVFQLSWGLGTPRSQKWPRPENTMLKGKMANLEAKVTQ